MPASVLVIGNMPSKKTTLPPGIQKAFTEVSFTKLNSHFRLAISFSNLLAVRYSSTALEILKNIRTLSGRSPLPISWKGWNDEKANF